MKKKLTVLVLAAALTINLTACDVGDTGLSDGELKQVAEYAAKLVLRHTRNYEPSLQEELEVKENPGAIKENFDAVDKTGSDISNTSGSSIVNDLPEDKEEEGNKENTVSGNKEKPSDINETNSDSDTAAVLNDVYDEKGFEVVYGGAGEYSRYPKNEGYFSLVAADNMKLYVVEFSIRNKTSKSKKFSQGDDVAYNLTFDGNNYYKPSLTLLENDMQSIDATIGGGKSFKGVVVFNVPMSEDKNKAKLKVVKGAKSYTLSVSQ